MYDHGARNRNPVSTLWYGIDPLFEKYPDYSPYNYCAGNPVKLVDLDGRDKYVFNEDGTFSGQVVSEKGEHYGYVLGKNITFQFADAKNDPKLVKSQDFGGLHFVTDGEIKNALWNSGIYNNDNKNNKYTYAKNESSVSKGTGKMDYKYTANFEKGPTQMTLDANDIEVLNGGGFIHENVLYLTKTGSSQVAHNSSNFGIFFWGGRNERFRFF